MAGGGAMDQEPKTSVIRNITLVDENTKTLLTSLKNRLSCDGFMYLVQLSLETAYKEDMYARKFSFVVESGYHVLVLSWPTFRFTPRSTDVDVGGVETQRTKALFMSGVIVVAFSSCM